MRYQIKAFSIYEKGHYRDTQEDSIFPPYQQATEDDRLFMVCDGMGGHEAGEVASQAVCEAMGNIICKIAPSEVVLTEDGLSQALTAAYDLLDERDPNPVSEKKMGTTMTLLKLHNEGATIAHIGDSRVYQFRTNEKGKMEVVHKTQDHSLVNDLLKVGELTPEEVENFPQKNVITRAMQSNMDRRPKAEITQITDVRAGDYFLLCSDGMLEHTSDENLCYMIGMPDTSDERKVLMLKDTCENNHDNHSAYLIHILDKTSQTLINKNDAPKTNADSPRAFDDKDAKRSIYLRYLTAIITLSFFIAGMWLYALKHRNTEEQESMKNDDVVDTFPARNQKPAYQNQSQRKQNTSSHTPKASTLTEIPTTTDSNLKQKETPISPDSLNNRDLETSNEQKTSRKEQETKAEAISDQTNAANAAKNILIKTDTIP